MGGLGYGVGAGGVGGWACGGGGRWLAWPIYKLDSYLNTIYKLFTNLFTNSNLKEKKRARIFDKRHSNLLCFWQESALSFFPLNWSL